MRICFIGDSFVNGTGDDACLGWSGRLCAEARQHGCDITYYNLGVRGETTAEIAARWQREARARLPLGEDGRLVFSFGVNDCVEIDGRRRVAESTSLSHARAILSTAKASLPSLMIGPPPTGDAALNTRTRLLADALDALCHELAIPFFSPWEALIADGTWLREAIAGDGAHPNRGGYGKLAALIRDWPPWRGWVETRP
jgi:lysophospholipase L1-like esterase